MFKSLLKQFLLLSVLLSNSFLAARPTQANVLRVALPQVHFSDASYSISEGAGQATIIVTLSTAPNNTATVEYVASPGSATAGKDYVTTAGALAFAAGETSQSFDVLIVNDELDEGPETVTLILSNPVNAELGDPNPATLTIYDNDPTPVAEFAPGDQVQARLESAGSMTATVRLSAPSGLDVMVTLAFSGTAGRGEDYTAISDTLTIPAGDDEGHALIAVNDDSLDEHDETVILTLGTPINATLGATSVHTATILDDDDPPSLSITGGAAATIVEGDEGATIEAAFTVSLSAQSSLTVTVDYATANVTADGMVAIPGDYVAVSGTLDFAPGETCHTITVTVQGDYVDENDEVYVVNLSNAHNASIGNGQAVGTILDDDTAGADVVPVQVNVTEGGGGDSYEVALASRPTAPVTITIQADKQITLSTPTLIFDETNWHVAQAVTVTAVDDVVAEDDYHSSAIVHDAVSADPFYASIALPDVVARIADNDGPGVDVSPASLDLTEGQTAAYEIVLFTRPTSTVTITLLSAGDQVALSTASLTFDSTNWHVAQAITVTAVDDWDVEPQIHISVIAHSVTSADEDYDGLDVPDVAVHVADNDANRVYFPVATRSFTPPQTRHELDDAPDACPGHRAETGHFYLDDWDHEGDEDWYTFQVITGTTYIIETGGLMDKADTVLVLYDQDCITVLAENDDLEPGNRASRIVWQAQEAGAYHVLARSFDGQVYGADTGYTFKVAVFVPGQTTNRR